MRKVRFKFKRNVGVWGLAFPDEWRIELDPYLDDKTLIDIAVHETTHVVASDLSTQFCHISLGKKWHEPPERARENPRRF